MRTVKVTSIGLLLLGLGGAGWESRAEWASERDGYRLVTWSSLSDHSFSPLVQRVHEAEGKRWRHAESDHVVAHARSVGELSAAMEEAHHAWYQVGHELSLPEPTNRARLVYVYETATWETLGREAGIRPDGLALQSGRDILLKMDETQTNRLDRVAHEMVHFRLREAYVDRLPLWLEEGLATLMGMSITRQYYSRQGRPLAGAWPAVPVEGLMEPEILLTAIGYPPSPGAAQAFGRQAAELTAQLRDRVGLDRWPMAVQSIGQRGDWRSVLASGYGVDMSELNQMAVQAAGRAAQRWNY